MVCVCDARMCCVGVCDVAVPCVLSTRSVPYVVKLLRDTLCVSYVGKGNHALDVGSVRADRTIPEQPEHAIYYYEVSNRASTKKAASHATGAHTCSACGRSTLCVRFLFVLLPGVDVRVVLCCVYRALMCVCLCVSQVTIVEGGHRGKIAIGLAPEEFPLAKQTGEAH